MADEIILTGGLVNLAYLLITLAVTRLAVRYIAMRTGTDFNEVVKGINRDPKAAAIFWGATGLGVCILAASFQG